MSERTVPDIAWEVDDFGVGVLTLGRPERRGAFTLELIDRWAELLRSAATDPQVRVVVLTGAPGSFCSGIDLSALRSIGHDPQAYKQMLVGRIHQVAHACEWLDKPYLAAISGDALGAGLDMALMCDLRFAAVSARFSEAYIKLGLVPGDGGAHLLPPIVGRSRALHLLWTGELLTASQAAEIGLVDQVFTDSALMPGTLDYARALAAKPPMAVAMIKRAVYQAARLDLRTSLDLISSHMAVLSTSPEHVSSLGGARRGSGTTSGSDRS
ncbi:enoyl-CoA hydratase/isomerase family protein [Mycolicibacterium tokaiense]|uniref:Enoyl-CoA hydratase/carnithine racemase n=1 Tax=Mycolicibacterium tokaiense TaxID=39695 RepID=A0A378TAN3_9MYCO|nr:enoyl-CoA hydratase/isomerase family protein [Mycolicibacterium tokaiense]BBY88542.1 enoyl-CoA hydratase [Mycolicibacterium tokaiense]STZ56935.1 enoyl-CoA hydratase/carnithine racemase [Mycolicibacterium tokaiense]